MFIKLFPEPFIRKGKCPDVYGLAIANNINNGELFYFKLIFTNKIEWIKMLKSADDQMGEFIENSEYSPEDIEEIKKIFQKHRTEPLTCSCTNI